MNKHVLQVQYDELSDDFYLQFTDEMMKELEWEIGDSLQWIDNKDGTFTIQKPNSEQ